MSDDVLFLFSCDIYNDTNFHKYLGRRKMVMTATLAKEQVICSIIWTAESCINGILVLTKHTPSHVHKLACFDSLVCNWL